MAKICDTINFMLYALLESIDVMMLILITWVLEGYRKFRRLLRNNRLVRNIE